MNLEKIKDIYQNFSNAASAGSTSGCGKTTLATAQKISFPLRISLVHVTKSADFCGCGHIY